MGISDNNSPNSNVQPPAPASDDKDDSAGTLQQLNIQIEKIRNGMDAVHASCINHTYEWRYEQVTTMERMIREHTDEFVAAVSSDLGCTAVEANALQIQTVLTEIDVLKKQLREYSTPKRIPSPLITFPAISVLYPMPLRSPAVLVLGPSNYPLSLSLQPAVGALGAGNPVIIKPSEHCPAVSAALATYIPMYFNPTIAVVIEGAIVETTALLSHAWGLIFFTGSTTVGKIVATAAAQTLTPTVLELGGKCPTILDPETCVNVNWELVANRILWSKFMNSGQTCAATDTLVVSPSTLQVLEPYLVKSLYEQFGTDTALTTSSQMGRIVSHRNAKRLYQLIEQVEQYIAKQGDDIDPTKRCRIVVGGTKYCTVDEKFIAPTIIINPPLDCNLMKEEIFGPILPIVTVADRNEAIQFVQSHMPKTPLCLYIFTKSDVVYREYTTKIRAGSCMRNDCLIHLASPVIPFGGLGTSGYGSYHGKYTLETFTHWTPSMYRPLVPGSDLNKIRFHPFPDGSIKRWFFMNTSLFGTVPVLHFKEATIVTALLVTVALSILFFI